MSSARIAHGPALLLVLLAVLRAACLGQEATAGAEPLAIRTTSLPKAYLRQQYEANLEAQGGSAPVAWELRDGVLPPGLELHPDGRLTGIPEATGDFRFTVTVTDSGKPAAQKSQQLTLTVVAPLFIEWKRYPVVNGQRVEGSISASNNTGNDFDFTFIALAVNATGRATAIGYQHFVLKKGTVGFEIPFGDNLPKDEYELNVDAVAEVAATNAIYRARLVPKEKLRIVQGP